MTITLTNTIDDLREAQKLANELCGAVWVAEQSIGAASDGRPYIDFVLQHVPLVELMRRLRVAEETLRSIANDEPQTHRDDRTYKYVDCHNCRRMIENAKTSLQPLPSEALA